MKNKYLMLSSFASAIMLFLSPLSTTAQSGRWNGFQNSGSNYDKKDSYQKTNKIHPGWSGYSHQNGKYKNKKGGNLKNHNARNRNQSQWRNDQNENRQGWDRNKRNDNLHQGLRDGQRKHHRRHERAAACHHARGSCHPGHGN